MRTRIPGAYWAALTLLVTIWACVSFLYFTGAAGVRFTGLGGGATLDFKRGSDYQLFRVADHLALQLDRSGATAIVDYAPATAPVRFLCGAYQNDGIRLEDARVSGDWLYGRPVEIIDDGGWKRVPRGGVAAVNLQSGETLAVARPAGAPAAALPPELVARGLTAQTGAPIDAALAGRLRPLSTCNESCEVFNWAFLVLVAAMAAALPALLWFRRRGAAAA